MSFFESLRRLFGGAGRGGRSGGTDSSGNGRSPEGTTAEPIACEEASARLFEYLDGELEGVSEEEVRVHLDVCEGCYPRVQFEKHFLDALQRSQNGGRVSDELRDRVLRSLSDEREPD